MKNQYFGDINDYKKYGLIRQLNGFGQISTAVCWMLTPDDLRPDGHRIRYLLEPETWREFDPVVFDHLREHVIERRNRAVNNLENSGVLPNSSFYSEIVQDDACQRTGYLLKFLEFAHNSSLVFFDPDNGMEVKSVRSGRRNSSKYLYFSEVQKAFSGGHSLLIYQHLPPKPRRPFVSELASRFRSVTDVSRIYLYWTQFVVFFLIPQPSHEKLFLERNERITEVWKKQIEVEIYNTVD
jgi:hypothetical protein